MFIDNVDIFAYLHKTKYVPGYHNWELPGNNQSLRSNFKKMITRSDDIPYKKSIRNITREDLSRAMDLFDAHVLSKGKIPFEMKVRYLSKYGSTIYMLIKAAISRWDEKGEPISMKGCNMDITNFVARKNELYQQNEKFDLVLDGINAGVWERNIETGSEWWSDKFYELLGYRPGEIDSSYDNFQNYLLHPDDAEKMNAAVSAHLQRQAPCIVEIRLLHKDGNYYWYETTGKAKFDHEGKPVQMVGSIINRHPKRSLEAELEKSRLMLNETGKITKTGGWEYVFGDAKPVWTKQVFDIYEIDNDAELFIEETSGFFHGTSKDAMHHAYNNLKESGEPFDLELQALTAKGKKIWIRTIGNPLRNDEGKITGASGTVQDITEQKTKELELRKTNELNIAQNKRLSNFAYIVSHNLRAHAGNITSLLSLLDTAKSEEEKTEIMIYLKKISASLNNTISELNDVAEAQNTCDELKKDLRFETALKNIIAILNSSLKESDAILDVNFDNCPDILYVPAYLDSILLNLLSNAIKYRDGQKRLCIAITTYEKNGCKFLSVTDNGIGIDLKKNQDQLFGMYQTFHDHPEASGIGLFLTRNQVESMGGNIYVCSTPGEGTTFTVRF